MNFLTIGHRGAMGHEPENTLRSFVRAERSGVDLIELDLHLSKDGALVVMHDAEVDRTTDGRGPIAEKTLAELRELDAGQGERVPVFEEVLEAVGAPLQAEIKDVAAARALAEVLAERQLTDRVEVISFHDEALAETARLLPGVRTALVASRYGTDVVDRALAVGATALVLNLRRLTLEIAQRAHKADLRFFTWTVNTEEQLRLALAFGADGVTTDLPEIKEAAARLREVSRSA
ncbi:MULTISPECIES: glycerophosphodiester phosphodiesterase [unclassified Streptomyces]|uniref:glycerophosphodiester phosphodiesterase n=1 Tax=unclassified Streptomyces TaxID=2593676 RepID=UPI000372F8FC|nr:glycerophosphodiester phosphodiesterase family protein [Streptomyces sp. LaPpAH-202]MYW57231.1 glycerophosphodiester phosphodiesterase [Streptomyces sp. SID8370]MYW85565.1 glycerophosphodiester phosphodiesterase [Streptomyces sp. SID8371]